jgi:hypothetical protein
MQFNILVTPEAQQAIDELANTDRGKYQKVLKTLGIMQTNLRHPGLHTHEYMMIKGPNNEKVFEAYVENKTPAAYRVFWCYGPGKANITIITVTTHP